MESIFYLNVWDVELRKLKDVFDRKHHDIINEMIINGMMHYIEPERIIYNRHELVGIIVAHIIYNSKNSK